LDRLKSIVLGEGCHAKEGLDAAKSIPRRRDRRRFGWLLVALGIRKINPHIKVTVIHSSGVPVTGVCELTQPNPPDYRVAGRAETGTLINALNGGRTETANGDPDLQGKAPAASSRAPELSLATDREMPPVYKGAIRDAGLEINRLLRPYAKR